jgi:hypothetical protein
VVLMFVGVGIFGLLAASLASFFIERDLKQEEQQEGESDAQLAHIASRLERIERLLATPQSPIQGTRPQRALQGGHDDRRLLEVVP